MAKIYASSSLGLNLSQSLAALHIVPRYEGIFYDICCGDITNATKRFQERSAFPNSTDKYGHSLIAMVNISSFDIIEKWNNMIMFTGSWKWPCRPRP